MGIVLGVYEYDMHAANRVAGHESDREPKLGKQEFPLLAVIAMALLIQMQAGGRNLS